MLDEDFEKIFEEATKRHREYLRRTAVGGQVVTHQIGLDYWIARVTWEEASIYYAEKN